MDETATRVLNVLQPEVEELIRARGLTLMKQLLEEYAAVSLKRGANWVAEKECDATADGLRRAIGMVSQHFKLSVGAYLVEEAIWKAKKAVKRNESAEGETVPAFWQSVEVMVNISTTGTLLVDAKVIDRRRKQT